MALARNYPMCENAVLEYPARTMARQLDQVPKKNRTVMQQPSA
jgi:hypothetical protein